MRWIGLTGGIACGKSQVAQYLRDFHIPVVDADKQAHKALVHGTSSYDQVVAHFGSGILDGSHEIDRRKLGALVFSNETQRLALERIIHPFVQKEVLRQKEQLQSAGEPWAVYDVPLLFESGLQEQFDRIIVVTCTPEIQRQRLKNRNGWGPEEAQLRIDSQWPLEKKEALGDYVIPNNETLTALQARVKVLVETIEGSSLGSPTR